MTKTELLRHQARSVLSLGVEILCSESQDSSAKDLAYESIQLATQTLLARYQQLSLPEADASEDYATPEATPPPVTAPRVTNIRGGRSLGHRLGKRHGNKYRALVINRRQLDWYLKQPKPRFASSSGSRQVDIFWAAVRLSQNSYSTFSDAQLENVAGFPPGRAVHAARKRLQQEGLLELADANFTRRRGQGRRYRLTERATKLVADVEAAL